MNDTLPFHLRALLEVIEEPTLLVQPNGRVLGANAALIRQLKVAQAVVTERPLAELIISPVHLATTYLRRASGSRQSTVGAMTFRTADGSGLSCRCYANLIWPAHNGEGAILSLRCRPHVSTISPFLELNRRLEQMTKEIARRQQAEARLEQLNRELAARVQQEVEARNRIQERLAQSQRLEALGQLAAGIAHDFNNVLQAVSGGLALIQRRPDNGDMVRRYARMAIDAAERGAAITGRLLAFARRGTLRAEAVNAGELLAALREMLTPTIGPRVEIKIEHGDNPLLLHVDRGQVETVLVNLAINARDAMPEGGLLTIAAVPEVIHASSGETNSLTPGHYVRLTVNDTGVGMDLATVARAADPFFTTKPVGHGTGLGLPMARGFAHQSGGGFAIESTASVGTTVILWFPQARIPSADAATVDHSVSLLPATKSSRVMVVDDDTLVREILVSQLVDQGHQIIEASDGLAALALLDKNEPLDLLVTDFAMPGMDGLALIKEVHRRRPELPALLLTGYADASVQRAIDDMKGWRPVLLRKPVRSDELAERAAALLAPASAAHLLVGTAQTSDDLLG